MSAVVRVVWRVAVALAIAALLGAHWWVVQ